MRTLPLVLALLAGCQIAAEAPTTSKGPETPKPTQTPPLAAPVTSQGDLRVSDLLAKNSDKQ